MGAGRPTPSSQRCCRRYSRLCAAATTQWQGLERSGGDQHRHRGRPAARPKTNGRQADGGCENFSRRAGAEPRYSACRDGQSGSHPPGSRITRATKPFGHRDAPQQNCRKLTQYEAMHCRLPLQPLMVPGRTNVVGYKHHISRRRNRAHCWDFSALVCCFCPLTLAT
jgi:hypothetical protein